MKMYARQIKVESPFLRILPVSMTFIVLMLLGCGKNAHEEVSRLTSPDGVVDAVIIRENFHATVPYVYKLFILPKSKVVDEDSHELFHMDSVMDLEISWRQDKFLDVFYKEARIFSYKNFWHSKSVDNFMYVVEVRLNPPDGFSLKKQVR